MGNYYGIVWSYGNSLEHHGILGQKWGIRRFQNEDGTLTPAGRKRYGENSEEAKAYLEKAEAKYKMKQTSKNAKEAIEAKQVYRRLRRAEGHDPYKEYIDEADSTKKATKNFDKLSTEQKKELGNKILDTIDKADDYYDDADNYSSKAEGNDKKWSDVEKRQQELEDWIFDRVMSKSGAAWDKKSVSAGHKKAMNRITSLNESMRSKSSELFDRVKKDNPKANYTQLNAIVKQTSGYKEIRDLQQQLYDARQNLISTVLNDVGFEDSEKNRKRFSKYVFDD